MKSDLRLVSYLAVILTIVAAVAPRLVATVCADVYPYGCPTSASWQPLYTCSIKGTTCCQGYCICGSKRFPFSACVINGANNCSNTSSYFCQNGECGPCSSCGGPNQ